MAVYPEEKAQVPDVLFDEKRKDKYITRGIYWVKGYIAKEDRATGKTIYFTLYPHKSGRGYQILKKPCRTASEAIAYRAQLEETVERWKNEADSTQE